MRRLTPLSAAILSLLFGGVAPAGARVDVIRGPIVVIDARGRPAALGLFSVGRNVALMAARTRVRTRRLALLPARDDGVLADDVRLLGARLTRGGQLTAVVAGSGRHVFVVTRRP